MGRKEREILAVEQGKGRGGGEKDRVCRQAGTDWICLSLMEGKRAGLQKESLRKTEATRKGAV